MAEQTETATVGIRALKQNASAVVAQVAAGETVVVTDRGRPVARMAPVTATPLRQLIEDGRARPARTDIATLPRPMDGSSLTDALREDRNAERY